MSTCELNVRRMIYYLKKIHNEGQGQMLSLYYCHIQACFNVMFAEAETERERESKRK